jgi:maleylpyruvate isomerase
MDIKMSATSTLVLHNYFRSSAAYRVRIAMQLKGLSYAYIPVHLTRDGGMQFSTPYATMNPQQLVPLLDHDGFQLSQSLAIIEYLDEQFPDVRLLPEPIQKRARVRQIALAISCDIHPLQNLRVLKYLTNKLGLSEDDKMAWIHHWLTLGLAALESELSRSPLRGQFCVGDKPTMADCALVPQMFSAARFGVDTSPYPTLRSIYENCEAVPAIAAAHPARQPDSE